MGMVYEGFDPVIERKVAIKTILAEYLDAAEMDDAVARFKREAQAGGRLQHPGIVGVYEYGNDGEHGLHRHGVRRRRGAEARSSAAAGASS